MKSIEKDCSALSFVLILLTNSRHVNGVAQSIWDRKKINKQFLEDSLPSHRHNDWVLFANNSKHLVLSVANILIDLCCKIAFSFLSQIKFCCCLFLFLLCFCLERFHVVEFGLSQVMLMLLNKMRILD